MMAVIFACVGSGHAPTMPRPIWGGDAASRAMTGGFVSWTGVGLGVGRGVGRGVGVGVGLGVGLEVAVGTGVGSGEAELFWTGVARLNRAAPTGKGGIWSPAP